MINRNLVYLLVIRLCLLSFFLASCQSNPENNKSSQSEDINIIESPIDDAIHQGNEPIDTGFGQLDTNEWVDMMVFLEHAQFDIKYATEDNFMGEVIYDCPACFLRKDVARAMKNAEAAFWKEGYSMLIYDCYRPAIYQQKLWDIMPDKRYVAPPTKGSNHGRGTAVDLTLVDTLSGEPLDMGTPYDFFGKEAHPGYPHHLEEVQNNRLLLTGIMEDSGFRPITSEWWHFDFSGQRQELSEALWSCD